MIWRASIASSRVVTLRARIGQPVGIGEHRFGQADLARALGDLGGELGFVAGDAFGQRDAGIVAGLDDGAAQQVLDADLAVELGIHGRGVRRRAALAPGILADREFVGELEPALLELVEDVFDRHQLGEARREDQLIGRCARRARCRFPRRSGWRAARQAPSSSFLTTGAAAFFAGGGASLSLAANAGPAASAAAINAAKILR